MDKSSTFLASSSIVLTLCICIAIYITNQPQLHFIFLFSSSHPLLALNLLILLIIVSSHCFAISRPNSPAHHRDHRDQLLPLGDSILIPNSQDARTSKTKKQETLESPWNKSKEGNNLRQLGHFHITTEDDVEPPAEMFTQHRSDESTSSASVKLTREVSLTKEEVNRRVERFIRKFNDD